MGDGTVRLRQAVLAASELEPVGDRLRAEIGLSEPFADPGVAHFGLRNVVFTLGDTFLEVVSPVEAGTAAGRWLERRGGDCGYMLMFQLDDLDGARARARALGVREVFEVERDEISETHLHPADMRGAIVSVSRPTPPGSWPWGGEDWEARSAPGALAGAAVEVAEPVAVAERWGQVLGADPRALGVDLVDGGDGGLTAIRIGGRPARDPVEIGGVRFEFTNEEER